MSTIETTILTVILTTALYYISLTILRHDIIKVACLSSGVTQPAISGPEKTLISRAPSKTLEPFVGKRLTLISSEDEPVTVNGAPAGNPKVYNAAAQTEDGVAEGELDSGSYDPGYINSIDLSKLLP